MPLILLLLSLLPLVSCTRHREPGNILRVAVRERFKSLDPIYGSDYYTNVELSRAYEGLLRQHYLKRPYQLEPALAEAMPAVSLDGLTYVFKIRKGARFQDDAAFPDGKGREATAEDFVYSFKRLADPKSSSHGWWLFDSKIAGLNAWRQRGDFNGEVEGLKTLDRYTFVIKLTRPYPLILQALSLPYASVVPREAVERYGADFARHPVGTGPFRLKSLEPSRLTWERNPTFHGQAYPSEGAPGDAEKGLLADAGKPLPFVDGIVDDIVIEDQPAWLNFRQGNHDYLMKIPKDNLAAVFEPDQKPSKELRDMGVEIHAVPGASFNYVAFNMEDPVVGGAKNAFLRRAMSLAYDEGPAIDKFYLGLATRADSPVPPGIPGFDPGYRNPARQFNLARAKEEMAKAGRPEGQGIPELVYDTSNSSTDRQVAEYFQLSMARIGVRARINALTWPELFNRIRARKGQLWGISWLYDYPDAENGWALLYSKNVSPGSNESNYNDAGYDALYERIATMPDGAGRFALFARMRDIVARDVPWIFTVHQAETRLTHPWVRNFKVHVFEHDVEKYLRVDVAERARRVSGLR